VALAKLSIPQGWEQITPDWMTAALSGHHPTLRHDGTNRRARLQLTYSAGARPERGQIIVAVVPADSANPDPDELREHARAHLRGSRIPDRVVFRDELPTNATDKVPRRELVDELTRSRT
jgi:acyl-CoA synthetase (AMP-forming)/AMP-acid ligase II